jgi:hypothetical protein
MIPERVVETIHGPAFMHVSTRDERLRPFQVFAIGAVVHPDRETVTVFVPESRSENILNDLKNNGRVALAVGLVTHEAYQVKGSYISSRPAEAQERTIQEIYRSKVLSSMRQAGYPEQIARPLVLGMVYQPSVAITFRVAEVFLQTPGPEAGKKIA